MFSALLMFSGIASTVIQNILAAPRTVNELNYLKKNLAEILKSDAISVVIVY